LGQKARAALYGKYTPDIEDIKTVALPVLRHRIVTNFNAEAEGVSINQIIDEILNQIKI